MFSRLQTGNFADIENHASLKTRKFSWLSYAKKRLSLSCSVRSESKKCDGLKKTMGEYRELMVESR